MVAGQIDKYWKRFAETFAHPIGANGLLRDFISNPSVTGAYAEAWVSSLAQQMVTNLAISTGAIIRISDSTDDLRRLPQMDLVLWDQTELPALFRVGNFALVHTMAARGIIEVKRSITSAKGVQAQLDRQRRRLLSEYQQNIICVVVSHNSSLGGVPSPDWVRESGSHDPVRIVRLLDTETSKPDVDGIFALIYFLSHLARLSRGTAPKNGLL